MPSPTPRAGAEARPQTVPGQQPDADDQAGDDAGLTEAVMNALLTDPATQATAPTNIVVEVRDGHATLRGTVPSPLVRKVAEERAAGTPGIRSVVNELQIGQHV